MSASHGNEKTEVEGALFDHKHPRLVRINDYAIEATLEGDLLMTRHKDQPGVVAAVSSILAKSRINISSMQMGNINGTDNAVAIMSISSPLDSNMIEEIAKIGAVSKVMQLSM